MFIHCLPNSTLQTSPWVERGSLAPGARVTLLSMRPLPARSSHLPFAPATSFLTSLNQRVHSCTCRSFVSVGSHRMLSFMSCFSGSVPLSVGLIHVAVCDSCCAVWCWVVFCCVNGPQLIGLFYCGLHIWLVSCFLH